MHEPKTDAEFAAMMRKHKFRVGQRVCLSAYGRERNTMPRHRRDASGVVTKVDEFNSPTVRWDYRRTGSSYFAGFIEPDKRRPKARSIVAEDQTSGVKP